MVQKSYPNFTFSLLEKIDNSQWTLLKGAAGLSKDENDRVQRKLRGELQAVLNDYLSRLQGFEEAFSAKEMRDELVTIMKKLGGLRDYILKRTGESSIIAAGDSDSVIFNPYARPVRLMSAAFRELETAARARNPGVEIETFVMELELLYDAAPAKIQSFTKKSGRVDDYFFDTFLCDTLSVLKACLGLGPHQERTYNIVWQLSLIARKIIKLREYSVSGIAVIGLGETAIKQRIKRALKAEQNSDLKPE